MLDINISYIWYTAYSSVDQWFNIVNLYQLTYVNSGNLLFPLSSLCGISFLEVIYIDYTCIMYNNMHISLSGRLLYLQ